MSRTWLTAAPRLIDFKPWVQCQIYASPCAAPDSCYNINSGDLTLCYERIAHFKKLARKLPRLNPQTTDMPSSREQLKY